MDKGGKIGKNDMEIWNAAAEKSIDVTPPTLPQLIQIVPNKTFTLRALRLSLFLLMIKVIKSLKSTDLISLQFPYTASEIDFLWNIMQQRTYEHIDWRVYFS